MVRKTCFQPFHVLLQHITLVSIDHTRLLHLKKLNAQIEVAQVLGTQKSLDAALAAWDGITGNGKPVRIELLHWRTWRSKGRCNMILAGAELLYFYVHTKGNLLVLIKIKHDRYQGVTT